VPIDLGVESHSGPDSLTCPRMLVLLRMAARTDSSNLAHTGSNVAARVQSLAGAGEICISEALHAAPEVSHLLAGHKVIEFDAPLQGVEGNARVYRIMRG
jgi:class 3 adenylate cyclase